MIHYALAEVDGRSRKEKANRPVELLRSTHISIQRSSVTRYQLAHTPVYPQESMAHQNQLSDDGVAIHSKLSSRFASLRMFKLKSGSGSSGAWSRTTTVPSFNMLHRDRLVDVRSPRLSHTWTACTQPRPVF